MVDKRTLSYMILSCWFDKMVLATRVCRGWGSMSWIRASSCWKKLVWQWVSFQWLRRRIYILLHNYFPSSPSKYIRLSREFTWSACEGGQEVLGPSSGSSPLWVRQTKDGWSFRDRVLCGYCATIGASHSAALLSVLGCVTSYSQGPYQETSLGWYFHSPATFTCFWCHLQ